MSLLSPTKHTHAPAAACHPAACHPCRHPCVHQVRVRQLRVGHEQPSCCVEREEPARSRDEGRRAGGEVATQRERAAEHRSQGRGERARSPPCLARGGSDCSSLSFQMRQQGLAYLKPQRQDARCMKHSRPASQPGKESTRLRDNLCPDGSPFWHLHTTRRLYRTVHRTALVS